MSYLCTDTFSMREIQQNIEIKKDGFSCKSGEFDQGRQLEKINTNVGSR